MTIKPIAACIWAAWTVVSVAAPAAAQPTPDIWGHLRGLAPGTEILVTLRGSDGPGKRYFLAATDSELTTLNLTDPRLPRDARNVLRNVAETNTEFLLATENGGTLTDEDVRLGPAGIYVGKDKVGEMAQVVERVSRDQIVAVTRPGGAPLSWNRPVEIGLNATAVLTYAATGGDLRASVSFPVSQRHSLEFFAGPFSGQSENLNGGSDSFSDDIKAFFGFEIRQSIDKGRRPGVEPFISYGAVGFVSTYEDRVCSHGVCQVRKSGTHAYPPVVGLFGGGIQYTVAPRLAVRIEANALIVFVVPLGGRISVGFTVPIGGHAYVKRN